jgi:hypothetical protein
MWFFIFVLIPVILYSLALKKNKLNITYKTFLLKMYEFRTWNNLYVIADVLILVGAVIRASRLKLSFAQQILTTILIGVLLTILIRTFVYFITKLIKLICK